MRYLSVCSGIEAATVAWHGLGWKPEAFSEIEKFPSQVLNHHYPDVPNLGDMTKYKEWHLNESIDILVGGTPCQSFSLAGLRQGLKDPRGNLMLTYLGILDQFRPKWCVWENVPGVLSSNGGRDFGSFLTALGELRYGFAYRVLDAQNFGVAQRRRRVFVVGCLGDWRSAAEVLFESESLCRDSTESRSKREATSREFIPSIANTIQTTCHDYSRADGFNMITQTYALQGSMIGRAEKNGPQGDGVNEDISFTLNTTDRHAVASKMAVRRLTPTECERLQGFPDGYTDIKLNGKQTPDVGRYKALGNSMAVPVMAWIGKRIAVREEA